MLSKPVWTPEPQWVPSWAQRNIERDQMEQHFPACAEWASDYYDRGFDSKCLRNQPGVGPLNTGRESGILLPPFLLSAFDAYTSTIIPCVLAGYTRALSSAKVSIVSPIRWSSAENGISGIRSVSLSEEQGCSPS